MEHSGTIIETVNDYQVLDCVKCGFKHLAPIPSEGVLEKFYKKQYYESHKPTYISNQIEEEAYLAIAFEERLQVYSRHTQGRELLDIGCGAGLFLKAAKEKGWHVLGVEPSASAATQAADQGLNIFTGTFDEFDAVNERSFDVVQLKNVLEHLPNPTEMINQCYNILSDDGLLYLEVPNDYDFIQKIGVKIAGERNSWVSIPDHINYFNFSTLKRLVKKSGFKVVRTDTTFPMYIFLWFGKNFIGQKEVGPRINQSKINFELFFYNHRLKWFKRLLYRILARLGIGRTVIVYCRKKEEDHVKCNTVNAV